MNFNTLNKIYIGLINRIFGNKKVILSFDAYKEEYDSEYLFGTSSILKVFSNEGTFFYRESFAIKSFRIFFSDNFVRIARKIANKDINPNLILKDLEFKKNLSKLEKSQKTYEKNFELFLKESFNDFSLFGLPCLNEYIFDLTVCTKLAQLIQYLVIFYRRNSFYGIGKVGNYFLTRSISYKIVCDMLGASDMVPPLKLCSMNFKEKTCGSLTKECKGVNAASVELKDRANFSNALIKKLSIIECIDFVCFELDHRVDNYNVDIVNGLFENLYFFDNDEAFSFAPIFSLPKTTFFGCSPIIKNGLFNRPYIDSDFFKNIANIDYKKINELLSPYLNKIQLIALWRRLCSFKKCVLKSIDKSKSNIVIKDWKEIDLATYEENQWKTNYVTVYLLDDSLLKRNRKFMK